MKSIGLKEDLIKLCSFTGTKKNPRYGNKTFFFPRYGNKTFFFPRYGNKTFFALELTHFLAKLYSSWW